MNPTFSTTSRALLSLASKASGWSTLARRSAAAASTLLDRLNGLTPMPAMSICALPPVEDPTTGEAAIAAYEIGVPFERWVALTDAYAEQFMRMQRGEKDAREKAMGLSLEMTRMKQALGCVA